MQNIEARRKYSEKKLGELRNKISMLCIKDKELAKYSNNFTIISGGSYARLEASELSDMDYFLVCKDAECQKALESKFKCIQKCIEEVVPKQPAWEGPFEKIESVTEMMQNVGGQHDINEKITRRILFLIEGVALYNEEAFNDYRMRLIKKYINTKITDHQLSMFLLNDIIRYYRTVCVDFEYKTAEAGKPWGTRNIKLIYSRKLLYFSSVLVCAETAQRDYEDKLRITNNLFCKTPIERIQEVCGARADKALKIYDDFLGQLSDRKIRKELNSLSKGNSRASNTFRKMKNASQHFTWELQKLLQDTYSSSHPIHRALIL
jgi:predicted nucleotidyltransferase